MSKHCLLFIIIILFACEHNINAQQRHSDGLDDALRIVPMATAVGMNLAGVKASTPVAQALISKGAALGLTIGTTYGLKWMVPETRPDGSDDKSFPSGHAAIAFAGAHALHKDYGKLSPWISVAGYSVATFVAIDRVAKDRHHWYDVAAGAAIGVAATELSYRLTDHLFHSNDVGVAFTGQEVDIIVRL